MNDVRRLLAWFDDGALVRPSAAKLNSVDLARAVLALTGAGGVRQSRGSHELTDLIGPADHFVLVLVDGLGMDLLSQAPPDGFLGAHFARELQAVFPSTTAAALTSLYTSRWPAEHGLPGWWLYLDGLGLSITPLPFVERFTKRSLTDLGVPAEAVFTVRSAWPRMRHSPLTLIGKNLADTVYTRYSSGETPRLGYSHTSQAFEAIRERLAAAKAPTFTYLYVPHVDSLCHERGTGDAGVKRLVRSIDAHLAGLHETIAGRARIIVTADHGEVDVPRERDLIVKSDDALMDCLITPPSGEPAVPFFHVRRGRKRAFRRLFEEHFGGCFALIAVDDVEKLRLLGPGRLSGVTRRRLGTYIAIVYPPSAIYYDTPEARPIIHAAIHAGLSPAEMRVPLVIGR